MLRVNSAGYLEEGDPNAPQSPEVLSSDPQAGMSAPPQPMAFKDQSPSGQASDYDSGPSRAVKSGSYWNAFTDSLLNTAFRTAVGGGDSLSPKAIYHGMENLHDAVSVDPVIGGPARQQLVQGLKDTGTGLLAGDPEVGGNLLGQIAQGAVAPHVIPPAVEALAKGSGIAVDAARTAAGSLGRGAQSLGRGMESVGQTMKAPSLYSAPATALAHPGIAALEVAAPYAAEYGGRGLQAFGRSLEGLDNGGMRAVVDQGAAQFAPGAGRTGQAAAGTRPPTPARPSPVTAADVLRDQSGLPGSLRGLEPPTIGSVEHGAEMYAPDSALSRLPDGPGTTRQGIATDPYEPPMDVHQSVSDPAIPESPLDAAARQSTRDVQDARSTLHDPMFDKPMGSGLEIAQPESPLPASLRGLNNEPTIKPVPDDIDALTRDIPHTWNDPMMDRPMGSGLEIGPQDAPTAPVTEVNAEPVQSASGDLPPSLQALSGPEAVPESVPETVDLQPEPASPALAGLDTPMHGPAEVPLDDIGGGGGKRSVIDPSVPSSALRDELFSEGTTPERAAILQKALRQRTKVGNYYWDKANPQPVSAEPPLPAQQLPASWQALVDPPLDAPVVDTPALAKVASPKVRRKYTNTNDPRKR